ncbi:MAG: GntR family transcriptional regulator [Fimbriimonadaceae bacterium]
MHLPIRISSSDGVPIYQQIVQQIKYLVSSGRLEPNAELPPIRTLALQLTINPNTVARAYRELEAAGVVFTRRTSGTYVSEHGSPLAKGEQLRILADRADGLLAEAVQMGVSTDDLVELVRDRERNMRGLPQEQI